MRSSATPIPNPSAKLPDDPLLITVETGVKSPSDFSDDSVQRLVEIDLGRESASTWRRVFDYSIPGGDNSTGWTRWRTKSTELSIGQDTDEFTIRLDDAQNNYNDTEVILDNIRFTTPGN